MAITLPEDQKHSALLTGIRAKIDRAQHHFLDLHERVKIVLEAPDGKTLPVPYEYELEGQFRQYLTIKRAKGEPLDPTLPLIVGDCIHNLRSALDHLVYQLAILNGCGAKGARNTLFPVCISPGDFADIAKRKVAPFVSSAALAEIEDVQPYRTTNMPDTAPLWHLAQIDNTDKHRVLVVLGHKFKPVGFTVTIPGGDVFSHEIAESEWKPAEDGAEILRFEFTGFGKVHVEIKTASTVKFGNAGLPCDGWIVQDIIDQSGRMVEYIVDCFGKKFFGE